MYSLARATAAQKPSWPNSLSARRRHAGRLERNLHRRAQLPAQLLQPVVRARVGVRGRGVGVDDEVDPAGEVVDDRELVGQHEQDVGDVGEPGRAGRRAAGEPWFDVAHRVVAEAAGEPAAEAGQSRPRRGAVARHERAHELERIALVVLDDDAAVLDLDLRPPRPDAELRRQADERVAAEALAADDRLEQERVAFPRELQVQRQRRVEVGERLEHQRDAVVALRGDRAEFAFGDHEPARPGGRRWFVSGCVLEGSARTRAPGRSVAALQAPAVGAQAARRLDATRQEGLVDHAVPTVLPARRTQSATAASEGTIPSQSSPCTGSPSL